VLLPQTGPVGFPIFVTTAISNSPVTQVQAIAFLSAAPKGRGCGGKDVGANLHCPSRPSSLAKAAKTRSLSFEENLRSRLPVSGAVSSNTYRLPWRWTSNSAPREAVLRWVQLHVDKFQGFDIRDHAGEWHTASMLWPSGSKTKAP
jgi:hypothetical protein